MLPGRLARTHAAIRRAAPHAQVIVGYPRLFDIAPSRTDPQVPHLVRRKKLNQGADVLNTVISKTVNQQPGSALPTCGARFTGHGGCSADPWINDPSVSTVLGLYHPNQTGYREGYLAILDAATAPGTAAA